MRVAALDCPSLRYVSPQKHLEEVLPKTLPASPLARSLVGVAEICEAQARELERTDASLGKRNRVWEAAILLFSSHLLLRADPTSPWGSGSSSWPLGQPSIPVSLHDTAEEGVDVDPEDQALGNAQVHVTRPKGNVFSVKVRNSLNCIRCTWPSTARPVARSTTTKLWRWKCCVLLAMRTSPLQAPPLALLMPLVLMK